MNELKLICWCFVIFHFCGSSVFANTETIAFSDSVVLDTIAFEDMNDEYVIVKFIVRGEVVQLNINRKGSGRELDYMLWDMDRNGRMEAIAVYNVLEEKYDYHLIEHDLAADDLLEYQVQLEDIGFPGFYNSSGIPKAVYREGEVLVELNYYE